MKSMFANFNFTNVFAALLVARLILAGVLTAPRPVAVVAVLFFAGSMLSARIYTSIHNIRKGGDFF
jgi:hypothetical protein